MKHLTVCCFFFFPTVFYRKYQAKCTGMKHDKRPKLKKAKKKKRRRRIEREYVCRKQQVDNL